MNPWFQGLLYGGAFLTRVLLVLGFAIWLIIAIIKKRNIKKPILSLSASAVLLVAAVLFMHSHSTYYLFNDSRILGSHIQEVQKQYGEPDLGAYTNGASGRFGYYIYTDNGPVMPDHLDHYYYIEYDESGVVTRVYDGCQPGG